MGQHPQSHSLTVISSIRSRGGGTVMGCWLVEMIRQLDWEIKMSHVLS